MSEQNLYLLPAFAEGEKAARDFNASYGTVFSDYPNPYPEDTDERRAWNMGWNIAARR